MNAKHIIASVSLLVAAGAAFAAPAELNFPDLRADTSTVSRAAIQAEAIRARNAGELDFTEVNYPPLVATSSHLSREQVRAEVATARADGQLDSNEAYADGGLVQRGAPRTLTASVKGAAVGQ
jgi:uncharacterized membrane protein YebE (DUF533 family)